MSIDQGIFWLASYPKSGNTWFRIVLANLLNKSTKPVDLNHLQTGAIASARCWVDEVLGFDSALLDHDELDQLRPLIYQCQNEKIGYHKTHDAYTLINNQIPLFPAKGCLGALYFIRNPLDVAVSFANHSHCSIDQAIENMGNQQFAFCKGRYKQHNQLRQWLLSWSLHVKSWTSAQEINVLVLRYEDMKQNPFHTFTKAIEFLQLGSLPADIERALDHARIEKLQEHEVQSGFNEKPAKVERFFRKGIVGDWKNALTASQIDKVIHDHGETMQQYGYLDANQKPIE